MRSFIYPGNFKEAKTFLFLRVFDLITSAVLVIVTTIYAVKSLNLIPILLPTLFIILKVRFLEDGSNVWEKLKDVFNYLVNSQQVYFWEYRKEELNEKK